MRCLSYPNHVIEIAQRGIQVIHYSRIDLVLRPHQCFHAAHEISTRQQLAAQHFPRIDDYHLWRWRRLHDNILGNLISDVLLFASSQLIDNLFAILRERSLSQRICCHSRRSTLVTDSIRTNDTDDSNRSCDTSRNITWPDQIDLLSQGLWLRLCLLNIFRCLERCLGCQICSRESSRSLQQR